MQLVPIDLVEILIGLEEEWKWAQYIAPYFRNACEELKTLVTPKEYNTPLFLDILKFHQKLGVNFNDRMKQLLQAYFVCQAPHSFYTK